jgi:uncharacterized protein HemX
MPELTNINSLSKGVGNLARDAAYVAVGLGVLGYQRAQVQRVELKNKLAQDFSFDERLTDARHEVTKGVKHLDDLVESAARFLETSLEPVEEQLPPTITKVTSKAFDQAREVRNQIRQRVVPA